MEVSGKLHGPAALPSGSTKWDRRFIGLQRQPGRGGEGKETVSLPGINFDGEKGIM
jgi:hypothetical protein